MPEPDESVAIWHTVSTVLPPTELESRTLTIISVPKGLVMFRNILTVPPETTDAGCTSFSIASMSCAYRIEGKNINIAKKTNSIKTEPYLNLT